MVVFTHTHTLVAFWKWLRLLVPGVYREQGGLFSAPMLVSGAIVSREGCFAHQLLVSGVYREQGRPFCAPMLVSGGYREQGGPF